MAKTFPALDERLTGFILEQPVYFVGSAPLAADGHVNLSPKGLDTLRVLGPRRAAYLDLTGSGNETSAHLAENGRITLMFCAFSGNRRFSGYTAAGEPCSRPMAPGSPCTARSLHIRERGRSSTSRSTAFRPPVASAYPKANSSHAPP